MKAVIGDQVISNIMISSTYDEERHKQVCVGGVEVKFVHGVACTDAVWPLMRSCLAPMRS